jgi:hypothetical protein
VGQADCIGGAGGWEGGGAGEAREDRLRRGTSTVSSSPFENSLPAPPNATTTQPQEALLPPTGIRSCPVGIPPLYRKRPAIPFVRALPSPRGQEKEATARSLNTETRPRLLGRTTDALTPGIPQRLRSTPSARPRFHTRKTADGGWQPQRRRAAGGGSKGRRRSEEPKGHSARARPAAAVFVAPRARGVGPIR